MTDMNLQKEIESMLEITTTFSWEIEPDYEGLATSIIEKFRETILDDEALKEYLRNPNCLAALLRLEQILETIKK